MIVSVVSLYDTCWEAGVRRLDYLPFVMFCSGTTGWCSRAFGTQNGDNRGTLLTYRFIY